MTWSALAIDQSPTSSGWAHMAEGDSRPTWGRIELPSWEDREGEMMWRWFEEVGSLLVDKAVTHLFLENTFTPGHHETLTQHIGQYSLFGLADMACYLLHKRRGIKIEYQVVSPQQWRPPFLGSATAPQGLVKHQRRAWLKEKSVAACHARGWIVEGDDPADALGILTYCIGAVIDPRFAIQQGSLFRRAEMACDNERRESK